MSELEELRVQRIKELDLEIAGLRKTLSQALQQILQEPDVTTFSEFSHRLTTLEKEGCRIEDSIGDLLRRKDSILAAGSKD